MMRRLLFFSLGLLLGSLSAFAFAVDMPLDFGASAPSGVTVGGNRGISVPSGGWASAATAVGSGVSVGRSVPITIDGIATVVESRRGLTGTALAKTTARLARSASAPVIAGWLVVSALNYAQDQWWKTDPDYSVGSGCIDINQACELQIGKTVASCHSPGVQWLEYHRGYAPPSGWTSALDYGLTYCAAGTQAYRRRVVSSGGSTPQGQMLPASEQDIETAVDDALGNGSLNPVDVLDGLEQSGGASELLPSLSSPQITGPSSIDGQTSTSSSSGPAGQTETTTQTSYPISYSPGAIKVDKEETKTTTTPDGETTTETTTTVAAGGQPAKQEEKPFCELYPDAMACQPLGTPSPVELPTGTINVPGLSYQSVTAACPAPYTFTPAVGGSYELSWQPVCDGAEAVRPVVIAIGLLTAGVFVFVGMRRGQS